MGEQFGKNDPNSGWTRQDDIKLIAGGIPDPLKYARLKHYATISSVIAMVFIVGFVFGAFTQLAISISQEPTPVPCANKETDGGKELFRYNPDAKWQEDWIKKQQQRAI